MTFHDTLQAYKDKCESSLNQILESIDETKEALVMLEKQGIAVTAQLETLNDLMNTPPVVELPLIEPDDIEEMFDKRMETHDGGTEEEVLRVRQDTVYREEAMESVDKLDEINRTEEN